jgi:mycothiol synthase
LTAARRAAKDVCVPPTLTPFDLSDEPAIRGLVEHPSLAREFDHFLGLDGVARELADPYLLHASCSLAAVDGRPVGLGFAYVLPSREGRWAAIRLGVTAEARRRGVATALLERIHEALVRDAPDVRETCLSAWMPAPGAEGFARARGHAEVRTFWELEHRGDAREPAWPDGCAATAFDGSETDFAAWNDVYNASFADNWHAVVSTPETERRIAARPGFRRDGLLLARRDGRCVGFCRCDVRADAGEVAVLGVVPEARGTGLGRALLRWGVGFLRAQRPRRVTLHVDGANETALRLYRREGFEVARERRIWSRALR